MEKYHRTRQLLIGFVGRWPVPRLREPLDIFTIPSNSSPFQGVRCPVECEVLCDQIYHIGHERTPMPVGEEKRNTVYCIDSNKKSFYFTRSHSRGGQRAYKVRHIFCQQPGNIYLVLRVVVIGEWNAEMATLDAIRFWVVPVLGVLFKDGPKCGLYDYELSLRNDLYTTKHTQWFYFRVRNMKAGVTYRFTIVNLIKSNSLHETGMRRLLYSELAAWLKGEGWHRTGSNILKF